MGAVHGRCAAPKPTGGKCGARYPMFLTRWLSARRHNGRADEINVRRTHPNLYWLLMVLSVTGIALGANFIILQPTFPIFATPNAVWGALFLVTSLARIIALNLYRHLRWVRATMAFSMAYMAFLAVGTAQPWAEGTGSLQLPIMYAGFALLQVPLMWEPFVNPETAKQ